MITLMKSSGYLAQSASLIATLIFVTCVFLFDGSQKYCKDGPFAKWTENIIFALASAAVGRTAIQYFMLFIGIIIPANKDIRYIESTLLMLLINTIQTVSLVLLASGVYSDKTCVDFFGVKSTRFLWIDWLTSVPYIFFLTSTMELNKNSQTLNTIAIQLLGGGSIFSLFLLNFPLPRLLCWFLFVAANIMMMTALFWQLYDSLCDYEFACKDFDNLSGLDRNEIEAEIIYDRMMSSQCKANSSQIVLASFLIVQALYFGRIFNLMDEDTYMVTSYIMSYLVKSIFTQLLADSHVELLDPNKRKLVEQRKKKAEDSFAFVRYIFHEVRIPLNSLSMGVQLVQDNISVCNETNEVLDMMKNDLSSINDTLNDVLLLQKIEKGQMTLELVTFAPFDLIRSAAQTYKSQLLSKRIQLRFYLDPAVPVAVIGDNFRLEHVLGNLLSNAIKFSNAGSTIKVSITLDRNTTSQITVSVRDYGKGLSEEQVENIFDPYSQIRPGELQQDRGSGLSLSICSQIISMHGGTVECISKLRTGDESQDPSGGSDFRCRILFALPEDGAADSIQRVHTYGSLENPILFSEFNELQKQFNGEDRAVSSGPALSSFSTNVHMMQEAITRPVRLSMLESPQVSRGPSFDPDMGLDLSSPGLVCASAASADNEEDAGVVITEARSRVLICDDSLSNRRMLEMVLRKKGYLCDQCNDGAKAVELIKSNGVDYYFILFLDNKMPVMNGVESAKKLRKMQYNNLIVGVTGESSEQEIQEFEASGVDMVVGKPMQMDALKDVLALCHRFDCISNSSND